MDDVFVYAGVTRWGGGGSQSAKPDTLGGVFRLRLGEDSWRHMMAGFPDVVHVHCIAAHPQDPSVNFCGTHEGVYKSSDRGESWAPMRMASGPRQIWSIAFDPSDHKHMLAGCSPIGVYESHDAGQTWTDVPSGCIGDRLPMGDFKNRVMRFAWDPSDARRICAAMEVNGVMSSEDGGRTWSDRSDDLVRLSQSEKLKSRILTDFDEEGVLDVHASCISPAGERPAFLASRMGIFKSTDGARTWTDLEVGRWSQFSYGREIRASVCEPGVIFAALNVSSRGATGSVVRSADHGASWVRIDHDVSIGSTVTSIAQHPTRPELVFFAARNGQVFGTENAGKTWREYKLPVGCQGVYAVLCS